jgi:hypothetical protein
MPMKMVEYAHQQPAADHDHGGRRDDDAGGAAHGHGLAQEPRHLPLDRIDARHARPVP